MKEIRLQDVLDIYGGQIMTRITANPDTDVEVVESRRVLVPKSISADGAIDISDLPEEALKAVPDPKKVSQVGDIVMKLSPPYDAGIVTEESADCIVPSFCAIIKCSDSVDVNYLLAFLNSGLCKNQLKAQVLGAVMTVLSVGKVKNVIMPLPEMADQVAIGSRFMKTQHKLSVIRQIAQLESKRNDIVFRDLEASK